MAYFPNVVMPKQLAREAGAEVDGWPLAYNATDHNVHHREIRAIEQFILGSESVASQAADLLTRICEGGLLVQASGVLAVQQGQAPPQVQMPLGVTKTTVAGPLSSVADTILVSSTDGFPSSGYLTKFNSTSMATRCAGGGAAPCVPGSTRYYDYAEFVGAMSAHRTNQELIQYESIRGAPSPAFLGCTRVVNGTTAQDLAAGASATLVCGKAIVMFSPLFWGLTSATSNFVEFWMANDAELRVSAGIVGSSSSVKINDAAVAIGVGYSLCVVGGFENVSVDQLLAG